MKQLYWPRHKKRPRPHASRPVQATVGGALGAERWRGNDRAISPTIRRVEARCRPACAARGGRDDARERCRRRGARRQPLLETLGLTKAFGAVEVLSDISLAFHAGEVHAIIGENGAGKSTLMKIISGHLDPTRGSLRFDGAPLDAARTGRCRAARHRAGAPGDHARSGPVDRREHVSRPRVASRRRRRRPDDERARRRGDARLRRRSFRHRASAAALIARRQLAQIARALAAPHRIAIFDEPTASLTPIETVALLKLIRELKAKGVAVIYIRTGWKRSKRSPTSSRCCVTANTSSPPPPLNSAASTWRG